MRIKEDRYASASYSQGGFRTSSAIVGGVDIYGSQSDPRSLDDNHVINVADELYVAGDVTVGGGMPIISRSIDRSGVKHVEPPLPLSEK